MDNDRISTLYPDAKSEPIEQPTITPVQATDDFGYEQPAEQPVGNPYSLEPDSRENRLYGAKSKVAISDDTDLTLIYDTPEDQASLNENLGFIGSEIGASQEDISGLVRHVNGLLLTGEMPSAQDSMQTLYEAHGEALSQKLDDARTLIKSFPDLAEWLDSTGVGNDPTFINRIIKLTENNRSQARLQKLRTSK